MTIKKGFRAFLALSLAIFLAETGIMLVMADFDTGSMALNALFNSLMLTVIISPVIYVLVTKQILALLKEQEALTNVGNKNSLILDSLGEGVYGVGLDGNIVFMNREAERILGCSAGEFMGKSSHETFQAYRPDGGIYDAADSEIYATTRDGRVRRVSNEVFWKKGGGAVPVEYIATPIMREGRLTGAVVAFSDISERLRAAKELQAAREAAEAANKAKREFLATTSYEIRTPPS